MRCAPPRIQANGVGAADRSYSRIAGLQRLASRIAGLENGRRSGAPTDRTDASLQQPPMHRAGTMFRGGLGCDLSSRRQEATLAPYEQDHMMSEGKSLACGERILAFLKKDQGNENNHRSGSKRSNQRIDRFCGRAGTKGVAAG